MISKDSRIRNREKIHNDDTLRSGIISNIEVPFFSLGNKCAEYNTIGQIIQDNAELPCEECPFQYYSNLAHKYQECYARIQRVFKGKGLKFQDTHTDTCPVGWFIAAIISIIFNVILGLFAACAVVQWQKKKNGPKKKSHLPPENPTHDIPSVHPPQGNAPEWTDKEGADNTAQELKPFLPSGADPTKEEKYQCVAAIQLGERYCGFAFSKGHDPANVLLNMAGSQQPRTTTTRLLLRRAKGDKLEVELYGRDACEQYIKDKQTEHIYFDELNIEEKDGKLCIKDSKQNYHDAKETYKKFLECVVKHAREEMGKDKKIHDPKFIFAIPDHWNKLEIKLITEVIKETVGDTRVSVEPLQACLAVSPFLHEVKEEVLCHNFNVNNLSFIPGTQYAVLNLGSRFCDISILEVVKEKHSKDKIVDMATNEWKEDSPEEWFMTFLNDVFNGEAMVDIRQKYPEIYFSMLQKFEDWKTELVHERAEKDLILDISSDFEDVVKQKTKSTLKSLIKLVKREYPMELEKGTGNEKFKLKLEKEKVKDCFSKLIDKTTKLVEEHIIQKRPDLKCVCMTGVYAKVQQVQNSMKKCFHKRTVVIPSIPDLVVAQGAAFLGHKLDTAANDEQ